MPSWTRSRLRPPKRPRSLQRKAWISAESCNLNAPMTARGESAGNPCQHVALQTISVSFPRADPKLARSAGGRCGGGADTRSYGAYCLALAVILTGPIIRALVVLFPKSGPNGLQRLLALLALVSLLSSPQPSAEGVIRFEERRR